MKTKTILAVLLTFSLVLFSSICFATDNSNNMMQDVGNGIDNVVEGAGNMLEDTADGIGNVVEGATSGISQGVQNMGNGINEGMQNMGEATQNITNGGLMSDTNNNYEATRTATTANGDNNAFFGMNSNTWTWIIMGILAVAIVTLIWFYGKQYENKYDHDDNY